MTRETAIDQAARLLTDYNATYARDVELGRGDYAVLFKLPGNREEAFRTVDRLDRYLDGEPVRGIRL